MRLLPILLASRAPLTRSRAQEALGQRVWRCREPTRMSPALFLAAAALLSGAHGATKIMHSFQPPYTGNSVPFWKHGAGAYVNDTYIRITPARQSRTGFFWNTQRSTMTDWEVEFDFQIKGAKMLGGDGFAFWYTATPETVGPVYGSADYWIGLGVFFDTYDNNAMGQTPLITAVVNDGTTKYDSGSDGESQAVGKCSYSLRNLDSVSRVKIKYEDQSLSLSIATDASQPYEPCFKVNEVRLGIDKYFGLTAHTGDVADSHDIHRFVVNDLSRTNKDLTAVRRDYDQYLGKKQSQSEELGQGDFQHKATTMLHQIQDSINALEEALANLGASISKAAAAGVGSGPFSGGSRDLDQMAESVATIRKAFDSQAARPQVDRDFIVRQFNSVKGEISRLPSGEQGKRTIDQLVRNSEEVKSMLEAIQAKIGSVPKSGGSKGATGSGGGYVPPASKSKGWSWMTWFFILLLLVGGGGGGYWYYNKRKKGLRQYKLL